MRRILRFGAAAWVGGWIVACLGPVPHEEPTTEKTVPQSILDAANELFPLGALWSNYAECDGRDVYLELALAEDEDGVNRGSGLFVVYDDPRWSIGFLASVVQLEPLPAELELGYTTPLELTVDDCLDGDTSEPTDCPSIEDLVWRPRDREIGGELLDFPELGDPCPFELRPGGH